MHLICPECNLTKTASVVPVRLELCTRCERSGRSSYLVPAPQPTARTRTRRYPPSRRRA